MILSCKSSPTCAARGLLPPSPICASKVDAFCSSSETKAWSVFEDKHFADCMKIMCSEHLESNDAVVAPAASEERRGLAFWLLAFKKNIKPLLIYHQNTKRKRQ